MRHKCLGDWKTVKKADEKSGTDFTRSWQSIAHRKGYILIVQIACIGQ